MDPRTTTLSEPSTAATVALFRPRDAALAGIRLADDPGFTRVRRGVYVEASPWFGYTPWDRYVVRVRAAHLALQDVVFAMESAAVVHGLPIFGEPRHVHLQRPTPGKATGFGDIRVHASRAPRELAEVAGVRATSVADTTIDLARVLPPAFGLAVADAAMRRHGIGRDELRAAARAMPTRRNRERVEWIIATADARAESPGESVSRAIILWCGFEPPELQVELVTDGVRDRVDFGWPHRGVYAESDGYGKYSMGVEGDMLAALRAEKRRQDRIQRTARAMPRWDWAEMTRVAPIEQRLEDAGIPRVGPRRSALLATVGHNPRSLPAGTERGAGSPRHG